MLPSLKASASGSVLSATFSPDGCCLAVLSLEASADGLSGGALARVWRLENGELMGVRPAWPAIGLALSDAGLRLAAASGLLGVSLWDVTTGSTLLDAALGAPPLSLALSPDGRWLAASESGAGRVLIFDLTAGRRTHALAAPGEVVHLAFSPLDGGRRLAAASAAGSLVWDLP